MQYNASCKIYYNFYSDVMHYLCGTESLEWCRNGRYGVSHHQLRHCFINRSFRRRSNKTSMLRVTGLCMGNSPVSGKFPSQMASSVENVSIWWRHDALNISLTAAPLWVFASKWSQTLIYCSWWCWTHAVDIIACKTCNLCSLCNLLSRVNAS